MGSADAVDRARRHIDAYIETRMQVAADRAAARPAAAAAPGDVLWSDVVDASASSGWDLVDGRAAVSHLLADYTRPLPPPTSTHAWLPPTSVCAASTLPTDRDVKKTRRLHSAFKLSL